MAPPERIPQQRKRVLILGGGFAGIGAARKLKDADVDVVLVDKHNYHTFQPLLYQVATDLLETTAVGHPLRDLFHDQQNVDGPPGHATRIDLAARTVAVRGAGADRLRLPRARARRRRQLLRHEGAAKHAFPMYTLADAVRLRDAGARRSGRRPTETRR